MGEGVEGGGSWRGWGGVVADGNYGECFRCRVGVC